MMPSSPQPPADPSIPQVLLFGHSGAGKSALLGALYQAGEKQGETLLGEVLESSGRLASLRDAVYRGTELEPTHTELTSYTVRLRPWRVGARVVTEPITIVLNDCSGKAAESLIRHPDSLHDPETRAPVARAVIDADAIILMVNGSADDGELSAAFKEFEAFLAVVGQGKANAREVGGFPVFLVLTQCDKLTEPGDTREKWESRVHEHAESAWAKFHTFLKDAAHEDDAPSPFLPFGSIELMVDTVAVRLPRLLDAPGQPSTPFRVAELFRDCFAAARSHRARVSGSNRRLKWTLRAALTFVGALLLGSIGVALFQPPQPDTHLIDRVIAYQRQESPAAVRLADPNLARNKQTLSDLHDDPGFFALRDDLKEFIDSRLKEIEDYEQYRNKLAAAIAPSDTRTLEDLAKVEQSLHGELSLPTGYTWEETPAGLLREKWLADVRAIREAESSFLDRYRDYVRRGIALTLTPAFGGNWRADVNGLVAEATRPPAALSDPLPGSPAVASPRGEAVLNRVPYEFDRVYEARKDWETTHDRLTHLRDLADALGLTAGPDRPEPVLVLPEPGPGINSVSLPSARWTALLRNFNSTSDDFHEWNLRDFLDPGRSILAARLDQCFRTGVRHVQALILARLGPDVTQKDTPESWRMFANVLTDSTTPFPEWGRLLHLYVRLRDPSAPNPILELAAFLRTPQFEVNLHGFDLVIPVDLSLDKVHPAGPLSVATTSRGSSTTTKRFKQVGEGVREGSITTYKLTAEGDRKITYIPGDTLRAELPVRSGNQDLKLVWVAVGSQTYPFDLFAREPRLVKASGVSEPAVGVKLAPTPSSGWPHIPVLFPELKR